MAPRGGDAITTIPLRKATRDRLKELGSKGETYDDILNRLMDGLSGLPGKRRLAAEAPPTPPPSAPPAPEPPPLVDFEPLGEEEEEVER